MSHSLRTAGLTSSPTRRRQVIVRTLGETPLPVNGANRPVKCPMAIFHRAGWLGSGHRADYTPEFPAAGTSTQKVGLMAKNNRKINRANHGKRPASSKARKAKRRKMGI
jgi:hypothetical protein